MSRVAVIGTGLLGSGIAEVLMRGRHDVVLHDFAVANLKAAHLKLADLGDALGIRVRAEPSFNAAIEEADFIVEAVSENLALKQSIFQRAGGVNARAIIMSNSSVLPIGEIAKRMDSPDRAIGTHWWNPPQLIPIVEVIRGPKTSDAAVTRTVEFHSALGKTPVRVDRDVPGFIGNRIQHALWREALSLVSSGECEAARVDAIVASTLGREYSDNGPWEQMKRVGWDRVLEEMKVTLPLLNSDATPAFMLQAKVTRGQLGAKTGDGFLNWEPGERERVAARLMLHVQSRLSNRSPHTKETAEALLPSDAAIASRLRVSVWRETLSLVANKVCSPGDVDRVVVNTIGLRLAELGPVRNADYVGLDLTLAIHEAVFPGLESSTEIPALLRNLSQQQEISV
jgi:3-hydroxybutyryl-CoA dehydrogenase